MNAPRIRWFPCALLLAALPLHLPADALDDAEKAAGDWVKLRAETSRLETSWQEERALLQAMLAAYQERAATAEAKRDLIKARTAKDRDELDAMRAKNQAEAGDLRALDARLKTLSTQLLALRPSLPPRLSDALEMSYRSLAGATVPPGERMQLAMNVLSRCEQFNRTITVCEDVLTLEGEPTPKSLQVIYWGLSHGYAADRAAHKAWLGSPGGGRWRWEAKPEAYDQVLQLLAMASDRADPDFVPVPATVARTVTEPRQH